MNFKTIAMTAVLVGGISVGTIPSGGQPVSQVIPETYISNETGWNQAVSGNFKVYWGNLNCDSLPSGLLQNLNEFFNSGSFCPDFNGNGGNSQNNRPNGNQPELVPPETNKPETDRPENKPETPEIPETPEAGGQLAKEAKRVAELVNEERAKAGLPALTLNLEISNAASVRAVETVTSFSHTRPNGSRFSTALTEEGIRFQGAGENIAWGQKTPEAVMEAWMNSSGHRANILNKNFTQIGIGYYVTPAGVPYWTQLFIY